METNNTYITKEVVVILPYSGNKVLLQLRDIKEGIDFPGHWGFFGGSIDNGESPKDAAERELFEEIGYRPRILHKLGFEIVSELKNLPTHAFCCPMAIPVEGIKLQEGLDLGLFTIKEILRRKLFSRRMGRSFPVIEIPYFYNTIRKLLEYLEDKNYGPNKL